MISLVAQIQGKGQADLFEIGKTDGLLAFLFGATQCRQQQRGEHRDNGDDHQ